MTRIIRKLMNESRKNNCKAHSIIYYTYNLIVLDSFTVLIALLQVSRIETTTLITVIIITTVITVIVIVRFESFIAFQGVVTVKVIVE